MIIMKTYIDFYERYWDKKSPAIDEYNQWKRKILTSIIPPRSKILDVGCGKLSATFPLTKKSKITGIDISKKALELIPDNYVKKIQLDLNGNNLPFKNEGFDVVLLMDVLEHLIDPERIVRESVRVLINGGTLICSVPNTMNLMNRIYFLFGKPIDITNINQNDPFPEHIRTFSKKKAEKLFLKNGLSKKETHYYLPGGRTKISRLITTTTRSLGLLKTIPSIFSVEFLFYFKKEKSNPPGGFHEIH